MISGTFSTQLRIHCKGKSNWLHNLSIARRDPIATNVNSWVSFESLSDLIHEVRREGVQGLGVVVRQRGDPSAGVERVCGRKDTERWVKGGDRGGNGGNGGQRRHPRP